MTQQQISTPSVVDIVDTKILSSNAHSSIGVALRDPWDTVLAAIDSKALDPATSVAGMDAATLPSSTNPFVTRSFLNLRLGVRNLISIGQPASNADFEGTTEVVFQTAIASLPSEGGVITVLDGTYTFSSTVNLPANIHIIGVHPLSVLIQGTGNFPVFGLMGENSILEYLTIENISATTEAVINLTGNKTSITGCRIQNYGLLGVKMTGSKSSTRYCLITSEFSGIWFQGYYQFAECNSFNGVLADDVLRFESSYCSAISNLMADSITGKKYNVISPSCINNKLVANHFGSIPVTATDYGTDTVKYANTPDTFNANENNFLVALQEYTGQPNLSSEQMYLSNTFAHNELVDTNATTILSSLDKFTKWIYEERNWYLTSSDPVFNSVGVPLSGVFTWSGTALSWPDFSVSSIVPNMTWTVSAATAVLNVGEAFVLEIDRTTSGAIVPTIKTIPLLLENSSANQLVLAYSPVERALVWTYGFSIYISLTELIVPTDETEYVLPDLPLIIKASTGNQTFDVDGMFLPINRFIGIPTDPRNTPVMPDTFSIGDNLTDKLSSQSSLLKLLYEKTNLWEYSDSSIDTFPQVGNWLDLTSNLPENPSHLVQVKGTTYALFPNFGLYRWYRVQPADNPGVWGALIACPVVAPFASMSLIGTKIAILTCAGVVATWDTDALIWGTITPVTSLSLPLPNSRPVGYDENGQADFIFQTPYYSLFSLLDGRSVLYFQTTNTLIECPRIFTETPKGRKLLGRHFKDTGFNSARENPWLDTSDSGATTTIEGLPLSSSTSPSFEIPAYLWSAALATVKWDALKQENCSFDPVSGSFLDIVYDSSTSTYYILAGGYGWAKLCSIVTIGTTTGFTDFTPHGWITDISNMEVVVFGATVSNLEFTVIHGRYLTGSMETPCWSWTRNVLGGVNSNQGAIGLLDRFYGYGSGNIHVLASDLARASRPTHWIYSRATSAWTSTTLSETGGGGSYILSAAVANSFNYNYTLDRQAGFGLNASSELFSLRFLIRDASRGNRPTLITFDGTTYTSIRLSEGAAPFDVSVIGADGNSVTQFYGGVYQKAWNAAIWVTRESSGNQIKLFFYFLTSNIWVTMSVGTGGTYLNTTALGTPTFTKRSGTLVSQKTPTDFVAASATKDIFIWTQTAGLLRGSITAHYTTGISAATWTEHDKRIPSTALPVFSTDSYLTTYSPTLAISRNDLSLQFGSLAEKTLSIFGSGMSESTGSVFWFEAGTKVKQITSTIWAGLNRGGYLWISNPLLSNTQQELTPNTSTVRGDIVVTNLGNTDDFDYAFNGSNSQIAFVYKDQANSDRLGFILYDIASNSITHERGGLTNLVSLNSTPQISYNSINNSWSIVAQDATVPSSNAKLMFFRRLVASSTWVEENVLASGDGKLPSKPIHHTDGSVVVVTESGISFDAKISMRTHATGMWSTIDTITGGGFKNPKFIKTLDGLKFWIFGGVDSTARIAWSSSLLSGWSVWSGTPSLSDLAYTRISTPTLLALTSSVVVASSTTADGLIPANREILVWRFENSGTAKVVGAFTAKGRLQTSIYSGEEEDSITDLSWTVAQKLLYGALRPTRTSLHWSMRGSTQSWDTPCGESLLGSGRYITLGEKHFREQWGSASATGGGTTGQDLIIEYPSLTAWSSLPLAQRESESDFTALKWPYLTSAGYLFTKGSPSSGITDDTGLSSGTLITSSSRDWPIILGNTRWSGLHHVGASVFSQGGMLGLYCPVGTTNLAYFGNASIGSSGLFKIKALAVLTFKGTRTWSESLGGSSYTLVGPVSYQIDTTLPALGSHFVLDFNTPLSLILDPTETPLSYWTDTNHSLSTYAIVVGEVREETVLLYQASGTRSTSKMLHFGNMESIEMTSSIKEWDYSFPNRIDQSILYEIISVSSNSFALKETGSLRGLQTTTFTPATAKQIVQRRSLPMNGCYLTILNENLASSSKIDSLITMLPSATLVFDKVSGGIP